MEENKEKNKSLTGKILIFIGIVIAVLGVILPSVLLRDKTGSKVDNSKLYLCSKESVMEPVASTIFSFSVTCETELDTSTAVVVSENHFSGYKENALTFDSYDSGKHTYKFFFNDKFATSVTLEDFKKLTVKDTGGNTMQFDNARGDGFSDSFMNFSKVSNTFLRVFIIVASLSFGIALISAGVIVLKKDGEDLQETVDSENAVEHKDSDDVLYCKYCGVENDKTAKKCVNCGAPLNKQKKSK